MQPDIHEYAEREYDCRFHGRQLQKVIPDENLRKRKQEKVDDAGPRTREPPDFDDRMMEFVRPPKERSVHRTVDPVEAEVRKGNCQEYFGYTRKTAKPISRQHCIQIDRIVTGRDSLFHMLPNEYYDQNGQKIEQQAFLFVDSKTRITPFKKLASDNRECKSNYLDEQIPVYHHWLSSLLVNVSPFDVQKRLPFVKKQTTYHTSYGSARIMALSGGKPIRALLMHDTWRLLKTGSSFPVLGIESSFFP
jgi:hypothetical protein